MQPEDRSTGTNEAPHVRRRRTLKVVAIVAATVLVLFVLLGVLANLTLSHLFEVKHRKHLKPMPIDARACPAVEAIHNAANRFQIASSPLDAREALQDWPVMRSRLRRASTALEHAVVVGEPTFPAAVQHYLQSVRTAIAAGRPQLVAARDYIDFLNRTTRLWSDGQLALGYAGDLIGHQCPVQLGADSDTMLFPLLTPTSVATTHP